MSKEQMQPIPVIIDQQTGQVIGAGGQGVDHMMNGNTVALPQYGGAPNFVPGQYVPNQQMAPMPMGGYPQMPFNGYPMQPQQPVINITNRMPGEHRWGKRLVAGGLVVALGAGAIAAIHKFYPNFGFNWGAQKPVVTAGVLHDTLESHEISISCDDEPTEFVGVKGHQNFSAGSATVNKGWQGSFLACGDTGKLNANLQLTVHHEIARDPQTGKPLIDPKTKAAQITDKVTAVNYKFPGLVITSPRVTLGDANCANVGAEETPEKIKQDIKKYEDQVAEGKHPGCDNGIHLKGITGMKGGWGLFTVNARPQLLERASQDAVPLALALDPYNNGQFMQAEAKLQHDMDAVVQKEYPNAVVHDTFDPKRDTPNAVALATQRYQQLIKENPGFVHRFKDAKFEIKNGRTVYHVTETGGVDLTVLMSQNLNGSQIDMLNANIARLGVNG